MAFRFALAGLLRIRENLEKQHRRDLQAIAQRLNAIRAEIETLERMHSTQLRIRMEQIASGVRAAELQFWEQCDSTYSRQHKELEAKLDGTERQYAEARERLNRVRLDREVVSNIRDHAYEEYLREFARKEQIAADERFTIGRAPRD